MPARTRCDGAPARPALHRSLWRPSRPPYHGAEVGAIRRLRVGGFAGRDYGAAVDAAELVDRPTICKPCVLMLARLRDGLPARDVRDVLPVPKQDEQPSVGR